MKFWVTGLEDAMYDRASEIDEAIEAGRDALAALRDAADSLDSAQRWGVVDILGGGLLTSVVKHSRLGDANRALADARRAINRFTHELADVHELADLNANVGSWNAFFDIALDNALADILVQKEISDAADRVGAAIDKVEEAVRRLEAARAR
ncbi:hypothetical protein [Paratractidigestivibacter sp.]|uniref:hypothetical protein n=2 Tax=Paratractidigestivibacter sp. TaxID=2847316 RepID=UPI002ABE1DED|nr:hypothetical protein [Paratractidigestivibacter sp.]